MPLRGLVTSFKLMDGLPIVSVGVRLRFLGDAGRPCEGGGCVSPRKGRRGHGVVQWPSLVFPGAALMTAFRLMINSCCGAATHFIRPLFELLQSINRWDSHYCLILL